MLKATKMYKMSKATEVCEATKMCTATEVPKATEMPKATNVPKATQVPKATEMPKATKMPKATEMHKATKVHEATGTRTGAREEVGAGWDTTECPQAGLLARGCPALPWHRHPSPSRHRAAPWCVAGAGAQPQGESVDVSSSWREHLAFSRPILPHLRLPGCSEKNNPSRISAPRARARVGFEVFQPAPQRLEFTRALEAANPTPAGAAA